MILAVGKAVGCLLVIVVHLISGSILGVIPSSKIRRLLRIYSCHHIAKAAAWILGLRVQGHPRIPDDHENRAVMAVANHVGYIDIILFLSQVPCVFITSQEMGANPILGPIAKLGGSYLVDRRNKFGLKKEIQEISELLHQGFPVFLFPEATSHDGSEILPFKRALLEAGVQTKAVIYPFCINYLRIDNRPIDFQNRNQVFFYGEDDFVSHMGRLIRTKSIDVEVLGLEPVRVSDSDDSRSICQKLEFEIKTRHKPVAA